MGFSTTMEVTVGWGDCDPAGIVFYPNYFRWFEEATWNFLEGAGVSMETLMTKYGTVGLPTAGAQSKFLSPCRFRDRLEIRSGISAWREARLEITHEVTRDGKLIAEGVETRFWGSVESTDPLKMKAEPIPQEFIDVFDRLDKESAKR